MFEQIRIGHVTDTVRQTGTTVLLFDTLYPTSVFVAGGAPASRELALLAPEAKVRGANAIVLSGSSAFGLSAADGVMRWLKEHQIGYPTAHGVVPIVPAAAIYDLSAKHDGWVEQSVGYQCCEVAKVGEFTQGPIGAGAGATVGKLIPDYTPSPSGLGIATYQNEKGLAVLVLVVVNAVGDVINAKGDVIAGAKDSKGQFVNLQKVIASGAHITTDLQMNTTLAVVISNGKFEKEALFRMAKVSAAGMGRSISPCFTCFDGDIVFATATQEHDFDETEVSVIASMLMSQAIENGIRRSR